MIALVDCNNFFASCERVFQPNLEGKPVIILSNNDGCAIARTAEAKALGIRMGAPYFEIKYLCRQHNVHIFSSNYTLYGDMSRRVMNILKSFSVQQEIYSIDECFLDLSGMSDLTTYGQKIRKTVKQWVGMPVCLGIGETKVLAKFANHLAKKHPFLNGVCNLAELGEMRVNKAMQITDISEVWGVGRRIGKKLQLMGINTVYDLKTANPKQMSKIFSVNIERIVYELNGIKCLKLEEFVPPNKQIISSRSFGQPVTTADALKSALTYHIEQACKKMRKQGLYTKQMIVFANTNRFKDDYFSSSINIEFPNALDSFRYMSSYVDKAINAIFEDGIKYKKCGIVVTELITKEFEGKDLFDNTTIKHDKLLPTLESIKAYFGKSAIKLATANLSDASQMQRGFKSNNYTTDLNEILVI
jgi:DNA polymerase V